MIFLTYNDSYSGIYKSQVIDVCSFFEKEFSCKTRLVALVSIRNYSEQRRLIKSNCKNSIILPMFPKAQFWKLNTFSLFFVCLFTGEKKIWARGPFACNMALSFKKPGLVKKVIFDARGAYKAELTEYQVVQNDTVKKSIAEIEEKALAKSHAQLAVSEKLVEWWKTQYNFTSEKIVIVPCTLSESFITQLPGEEKIKELRTNLGFKESDIILAYSGSSAGWQSFQLVDEFLFSTFSKNENYKLIFLSNKIPNQSKTFKQYADRIVTKWVKPDEVKNILYAADYGLLIREKSITNKVASPVKFAEYLACGLNVIISEEIGDFTDFVRQHHCGSILNNNTSFSKITYAEKQKNNKLSLTNFSKQSPALRKAYSLLLAD
ncbi:MAG TPA: hypothetical protein VNZ49_01970 [Bacteroidia bacterium]|jgi:hypothetical protein|nr:hypothetical protein [Bacteroidia bacterium]